MRFSFPRTFDVQTPVTFTLKSCSWPSGSGFVVRMHLEVYSRGPDTPPTLLGDQQANDGAMHSA
jgi:hypothetical protein